MTYPNAPITEALIDIQVAPRAELSLAELQKFAEPVEKEFKDRKTIFQMIAQVQVGPAGASPAPEKSGSEHKQIGFQYWADKKDRVVSLQLERFTFSKLAPYSSWEEVMPEARRLWDLYRSFARPEKITRLAVRYINRLDLPTPFDDFSKYLNTIPQLGPGMPQGLSNFFMQLQIPYEKLNALLVLNQTMTAPAREGVISIILDLDLFKTHDVPQDERGIWEILEQMRLAKNEAFEASITDEMRERFK